MLQKGAKFTCTILLILTHLIVFTGSGYAAVPSVKLIINPNKTDVNLGSDPIALTAKATGANLTYKWELKGPGKIDGDGSAVFYVLPETITGASAQALVTVTIIDASGQETTETVTFNIIAPVTPSKASPAPKAKKKGMSTTTKIALGVGAAAALGGGIALLAGGGDDNNDGPFTGRFQYTYTDIVNDGTTVRGTIVFNLKQKDNSISGDRTGTSQFYCCTASFTVPVSGLANGNSASLSWGPGEGRCDCTNGDGYRTSTDGATINYTLINNGQILRSEYGSDYVQLFISGMNNGTLSEIHSHQGEEYIRQ